MRHPFEPSRAALTQPNLSNTKKAQKRAYQDSESLNQDLDFIHERINIIVESSEAIEALSSTATLSEVIDRVNLLQQILETAGILKTT